MNFEVDPFFHIFFYGFYLGFLSVSLSCMCCIASGAKLRFDYVYHFCSLTEIRTFQLPGWFSSELMRLEIDEN